MAITGIDTIEGKQIIAAGAVSAKSAEMAYNDENGNPITGYLTAVPTGTMNESNFGYDASDNITAYNGSAIGGGSAPTYSYTDNDLISAIDTSGLYATSALEAKSANALVDGGRLGSDVYAVTGVGTNSMTLMVLNPQTTPFGTTSGIYGPLYYAQGACMTYGSSAGSTQYFGGFFKGNEWYISNATAGQALRGETHASRGVHVSGATTAGLSFDLSVNCVSGKNSIDDYNWKLERGCVSGKGYMGEWRYGPAEDAALRAVSSCDMHESAFEYDANDKISGYNGSAFAGDEFPQSATEAIETVTANSADWNGTTETVSSNSGAWGGSALPISAGPGIKFEMVDNTLVASTDGYVWQSALLFHTDTPVTQTNYTLSDDCSNYDKLEVDFYDINNWRTQMDCPIPSNLESSGTRGGYFSVVPESTATGANIWFKAFNWTAANTTWECYCSEIAATGGYTTQTVNANQPSNPPKVVNIIGWKRVGGN